MKRSFGERKPSSSHGAKCVLVTSPRLLLSALRLSFLVSESMGGMCWGAGGWGELIRNADCQAAALVVGSVLTALRASTWVHVTPAPHMSYAFLIKERLFSF